jgi:hypothetical protein
MIRQAVPKGAFCSLIGRTQERKFTHVCSPSRRNAGALQLSQYKLVILRLEEDQLFRIVLHWRLVSHG